jgi:hypothetical protein
MHQIKRAFDAARKAGVQDPVVEVQLPTGATFVISARKMAAADRPADSKRATGRSTTPSSDTMRKKKGR